jgi:hypothetical protein
MITLSLFVSDEVLHSDGFRIYEPRPGVSWFYTHDYFGLADKITAVTF